MQMVTIKILLIQILSKPFKNLITGLVPQKGAVCGVAVKNPGYEAAFQVKLILFVALVSWPQLYKTEVT